MIEHHYTIMLEPRGKGRPVFTRATGSARTPETTRAWEHEAAHQLREQHAAKTGVALTGDGRMMNSGPLDGLTVLIDGGTLGLVPAASSPAPLRRFLVIW